MNLEQKSEERRSSMIFTEKLSGLIIEDDPEIIEAYQFLLGRICDTLHIKKYLKDAFDCIENYDYNFVIIDGYFPSAKGKDPGRHYIEIVNKYKEKMFQFHKRPLMIHITGSIVSRNDIYAFLKSGGIDCFMDKRDFSPSEIYELIKLFGQKKITYGRRKTDMIPSRDPDVRDDTRSNGKDLKPLGSGKTGQKILKSGSFHYSLWAKKMLKMLSGKS